ncbi:GDP-L-fucose synthase [Deltaproteobacteria bacterium]|nr:GDP-L-fucose synthase [Deltaproteobacteria bacterium]
MNKNAKIFIAGHTGLAGSALVRKLDSAGYTNLLTRTRAELDLTDQVATERFFQQERPEYVFLAAAKVGGIQANNTYPAEFIHDNLAIQTNVFHASYQFDVERLLFLGSSCIYPRDCPQPMREEYLLTGSLEPTNRPYALAKIAGIEMCWSYNRQYGTRYLAVMPTNLYGPGDNYHLENSHVIPALLRKFHEAKERGEAQVVVWGSGKPYREFLYSDDMADACIYLMGLPEYGFGNLLAADRNDGIPPIINVGAGTDVTIGELAELVKQVVGFEGDIVFDLTKPDGTPRKLLDVSLLNREGWNSRITLPRGLKCAYEDFLSIIDKNN